MTPEERDLFRRLKPLHSRLVEQLFLEFEISIDEQEKAHIREILLTLAKQELQATIGEERILLEPPPREIITRGRYRIGEVIYPSITPYGCWLERSELVRHLYILGPTGTGKTTLILQLLWQLVKDQVPILVFDFKTNYRVLLDERPEVIVLTIGKEIAPVSLNALMPPPGVAREEWAGAMVDILSSAYLLMQGARNVLTTAFIEAWNEEGDRATFATAFRHLKTRLAATRGWRTHGWLESAHRALDELTKGNYGLALNNPDGTSIDALLARSIVLELHGLSDDQKRFIGLFILQSTIYYRKHRGTKTDQLRHALIFDEAQHIFPTTKPGELDVPSRLAREVREFGELIVSASQQTDLSESLLANSGIKIILRTDNPRDIAWASKAMSLPDHYFGKLLPGTAIVRLPIRHLTPFLIRFPPYPNKNNVVTDAEVAARANNDFAQRCTPATLPEPAISLDEKERALLGDVAQHAASTASERFERLHWNRRAGHATKATLVTRELLTTTEVTSPYGRATLFALTGKAREALRSHGIPLNTTRTGGPIHAYWSRILTRLLKDRGYRVVEEYPLGAGHSIDIVAGKGGETICIEVETGHSDIPANVKKVTGMAGRIIFFFTSSELVTKYRSLLQPAHEPFSPDTINQLLPG